MKIKIFGRNIFEIEKRDEVISNLKNPQEWLLKILGLETAFGVTVSPETSLTLPVYYSALKIIGEDIAKISGGVFKKQGDSRVPIDHPSGKLIFLNPSLILNSFHWRVTMMVHAVSWGNGYTRIIRDGNARPIELRLIENPNDVIPFIDQNQLWYKVAKEQLPIPAIDMFHIRGFGYNGIQGKPILQAAKEIIGGGLASQNYSNKNFTSGGLKKIALVPGAANLKTGKVDPNVEEHIKLKWIEDQKSGKPTVLAPGLEVKDIGLNPAEVEMISTQQFTIQQFARMVRIPPHKLMDLQNAHFNNIEHQSTEYVIDTLMPWVVQFEMECRNKLLAEREKVDHYFKFNLNSLMRGDSQARSAYYHNAILDGWMSRNEARALEDMNPGENLDQFYQPVNVYNDDLLDLMTKKLAKEIQAKNGNN